MSRVMTMDGPNVAITWDPADATADILVVHGDRTIPWHKALEDEDLTVPQIKWIEGRMEYIREKFEEA